MTRREKIAAGSIAISVVVLALKAIAWWLTRSAALYSDALESIVNLAAASITLWALRYAALPADENHLYGHGKAEFFAAAIEAGLILVASLSIFEHAWYSFVSPRPIRHLGLGLAVNAVASLVNGFWAAVLFRNGRMLHSPALLADAAHLRSDVASSGALVAGLTVVLISHARWLDSVLAFAAGVYVLLSGLNMLRTSVGGLMDEAPPPAIMEQIRQLLAEHGAGAIEAHDLRSRQVGRLTFLEFHLVVPGTMRVADAHAICDRIEDALTEEMKNLVITIHVEPEGKATKHGVVFD